MEKRKFLIGTLLVVASIIIAGYNLDLININLFFDGWWTLFIIIPSLFGVFKKGTLGISSFGLIFGTALLLEELSIIESAGAVFLPSVLFSVGLTILFSSKKEKVVEKNGYKAMFNSNSEKIVGEIKDNIEINTILGEFSLDLTEAKIEEDINIKISSILSKVEIKVPENVNVNIGYDKLILGKCKNQTLNTNDPKNNNINLFMKAIFSNVNVLN